MKTRVIIITLMLGTSLMALMPSSPRAAVVDARDVVHDLRGQVIRSTNGNCVRTRWSADGDECGRTPVAQTPQAERQHIADEARTVYFEFNQTRLMESEQRKLNSLATTLKEMKDISGVSIVGYADRIGAPGYNERLSERRAGVVKEYLRARGYLNTTVAKTRWLGESAPITTCADHLERTALIDCLQHDRRVTVEVQYDERPLNTTIP